MRIRLNKHRLRRSLFYAFAPVAAAFLLAAGASAVPSGPPSDFALDLGADRSHVVADVNAADLRIDGNAARTIEAWVFTRRFDDAGAVFSLGARGKTGHDFTLKVTGQPDHWHLLFWGKGINFSYPSLHRWVHFAIVHTGSETIVYADGNEIAREPMSLNTSAESPLRMGWWPAWEHVQTFDGMITEVRVWNRALDQSEVQGNMQASLVGLESGLAAYWPIDEGRGDTVREMVAGNDGWFMENPRWRLVNPFKSDIEGREVVAGQTVTLGPVQLANPVGDVSYQWYFNDEPIDGEIGDTLVIKDISPAGFGTYFVMADDERELTPVRSAPAVLARPDWPMWRYDAARSAVSPHSISGKLHLQWVRELPEPARAWPHQWDDREKLDFDLSYAPVVEQKRIFVPSSVTDSVTAYCIEDGSELWRFYACGPVRLAPAVWRGRVYFVSDDGYLYCLEAASGELDWKFRGGPSGRRLLGNERIINFWAARGGPVVKDGAVYFGAGIWPLHGVFIHALDAESGDVLWVNDTTSLDYVDLPHGGARGYGGLAPQGYLAAGENTLVVPGGRGMPAYLDRRSGTVKRASFRAKPGGGYAVHAIDDGGGLGRQCNLMLETAVESVSDMIGGEIFYKLAAYNRLIVSTVNGTLYCFGPEETEPVHHECTPAPLEPKTGDWAETASLLLDELGESEGYALILGAGSGDLLRELLLRSSLHVVVVESCSQTVRALRDELAATGMYGSRAAVMEAAPAAFSVQPYLFSLVLSEDAAAAGIGPGSPAINAVFELLRPYGGMAYLGMPEDVLVRAPSAVDVDQVSVEVVHGNHILARRAGPLSGAGRWTHQYHDAANTLLSQDELVRLPLGLLWFGGPNNHDILPRHSGGPRPQVAGGRIVYLGVETIGARCVYTGRRLWSKEMPGIGHPFTNLELEQRWNEGASVYMTNIPGATYIGSPFVTLPDSIYVRYDGRILRLDAATGETMSELNLPGWSVEKLYDADAPDWGHISVRGDLLIATAEPHIFEDQRLGWTGSYSGTSSMRLAVFDRVGEKLLWDREARIGFRHKAIVSSGDTLYVIDGVSEKAVERLARRGESPDTPSAIMAFDLKTGKLRWSDESSVFGTYLLYSAEHDILIEGGSRDMRRPFSDEPRSITARRGADGVVLWEGGSFTLPGAVRGEMLIPGRPGAAISLLTGEDWMRTRPHTGESSRWSYRRAYGCNTLNASKNLLLFRSGYAGYFDLEHDSGTGNFSGFRSGCTANMIAADGVLSALDYTRTCTCSYAHQTSLALVHMPGDPGAGFWTRYDASLPDPAGFGLNFGAPGRRVDVAGTGLVWHDREGTHRRHPSAISGSGGGPDWVSAFAREGNGEIEIPDLPDAPYRLRLHFAELNKKVAAGERVFDVLVNGEEVLTGFDIAEETGGVLRGTVKEINALPAGNRITVELRASAGSKRPPLINGILITPM